MPRSTDTVSTPPSHLLVVIYLAGLMLTHALPYGSATIVLDTARDLHAALQISGGHWLLRGPILNGAINLGPVWFYLLAPALALTGSQSLTLIWAGLLASAKFPLAYLLGRTMGRPQAGLLLAAMLALPGWALIGALFPTHTSLVETATLAQLLLLARLARGSSSRDWAFLGAIAGLAAHAHPSACFILLPAPLIWWLRRRNPEKQLLWMLLGIALAILPLLPALIADAMSGWPQLSGAVRKAGHAAGWPSPASVPVIVYQTFVGGPSAGFAMVESPTTWRLSLALVALLWLAGIFGLTRSTRKEQRLVAALFLLVVAIAVVLAFVRDYTPYYMALVMLPPGFAIAAIGLALLTRWRWFLAIAALAQLSGCIAILQAAHHGQARLQVSRLSNLRSQDTSTKEVALLPAWQLESLGRLSCKHPGTTVLHGSLAVLYFSSLELAPETVCGKRETMAFSGPGKKGSEHWLGLPPQLARRLGWQSDTRWLSTPKVGVIPLWPPEPLPRADRDNYPFFEASGKAGVPGEIDLQTPADHALITTTLLFPYQLNDIESVEANGTPARQIAHLNVTQVWTCDDCTGSEISWRIRLNSNSLRTFEAVGFKLPNGRKAVVGAKNSPMVPKVGLEPTRF